MATLDHTVTAAPADIVSALSLIVGKTYSCQVVSRDVVVKLREAVSAPATTAMGYVLSPREPFMITPVAGEGHYLWVVSGGDADVVVTESAR